MLPVSSRRRTDFLPSFASTIHPRPDVPTSGSSRTSTCAGRDSATQDLPLAERLVEPQRPLRALDAVRVLARRARDVRLEDPARLGARRRRSGGAEEHPGVLGRSQESRRQERGRVGVPALGGAHEAELCERAGGDPLASREGLEGDSRLVEPPRAIERLAEASRHIGVLGRRNGERPGFFHRIEGSVGLDQLADVGGGGWMDRDRKPEDEARQFAHLPILSSNPKVRWPFRSVSTTLVCGTGGPNMRVIAKTIAALGLTACIGSFAIAQDQPSDALVDAGQLQARGSHREAIDIFRQLLLADPNNRQILYGLALSLYATGEYREATHVGSQILAAQERAPADLFVIVGTAHGRLREWDTSERILSAGLMLWPDSDALRVQHAVSLEGLGRFDEAIAELEACLRTAPYEPALWRALGDALSTAGAPGRAFAAYVRSLTLEGDEERAREVAANLWSVLFQGTTGPSSSDAAERARARGWR